MNCIFFYFPYYHQYISLHKMYRKTQRENYTWFACICSSFVKCNEFHVVRKQTEFYWSCSHHIRRWSGQLHTHMNIHTRELNSSTPKQLAQRYQSTFVSGRCLEGMWSGLHGFHQTLQANSRMYHDWVATSSFQILSNSSYYWTLHSFSTNSEVR